jgi:hypothetical protein
MSLTHVVGTKMAVNAFFFFMTSLNPNKHAFRLLIVLLLLLLLLLLIY